MGVTETSFCSFVPVFLEQLVYDKGINFQRPSNGRCPASGRSGGHEADDHRSAITEQAIQGEHTHTYECGGSIGIPENADGHPLHETWKRQHSIRMHIIAAKLIDILHANLLV